MESMSIIINKTNKGKELSNETFNYSLTRRKYYCTIIQSINRHWLTNIFRDLFTQQIPIKDSYKRELFFHSMSSAPSVYTCFK
jgi:hypothetical protein